MKERNTEVLRKDKKFYKPSSRTQKNANVKMYHALYKRALKNPEKFWESAALELDWYRAWDTVIDKSKKPFYQWFKGGRCNIFYNCLERHQLNLSLKNKVAILWEDEGGRKRELSYSTLYDEVNHFAAVLKKLGVKKGSRVAMYMPNIPEIAIAMLSCAKIGALHSVVYAGFSSGALRERINDCGAIVLVTADGSRRRGKIIRLKDIADEAIKKGCPTIQYVITVRHVGIKIKMKKGKDLWFHELKKLKLPPVRTEVMKSTDPLFILYTSGTTARPKGVVHAHGGYMVGVYRTLSWVFDIKDDDIFWCSADPGWITGHSYIVYGPLLLGVTTVMYEGVPDYPRPGRIWEFVESRKVTIFYTAPTLIRMMMKYGNALPQKYRMKSLRLLGSVGEPINPEAWRWFYKYVGGKRCPIMDTWWQTETGMFMITPIPTLALKAGSATKPFFGIQAEVVDRKGHKVPPGKGGFLVIKNPWPAMLVTLYKNPKRYLETYWKKIPGYYSTGDVATKDKDGYFWIQGRSDDVLKIAGHRIGTAELESALSSHEALIEAGAIGKPDTIRGEVAKAFVVVKKGVAPSEELKKSLINHVRNELGPMAIISEVEFVDKLPKTRSGKIMRRVLKAKELGLPLGDVSTLED